MSYERVKKEALRAKKLTPSMYHGSYRLPSGKWQVISSYETKEEAEDILSFHGKDTDWFII